MLRLALSWTSESTGCSGNLWCRRGIDKSHFFREVIEGWSHVPLALAPVGVETRQCYMQIQGNSSTWLKNCQSCQDRCCTCSSAQATATRHAAFVGSLLDSREHSKQCSDHEYDTQSPFKLQPRVGTMFGMAMLYKCPIHTSIYLG